MSTATADVEPVPSDAPQVDPENPEVAKDAKPTEDDKPKPKPMVGCCSMYRFANTWEMTQVTIAVIASLAMGAIMPLFSIVFGGILDDLATSTDVTSTVIPFVLFYVYIAFGAWFLSFLSHGLLNATAERMTSRIRYRFFRALLRNDMDYHDLHEAGGEVAARLGADCDAVKEGLGIKLAESITAVATFFTGVSIAFSIRPDAWKLALVITACLPFMIVAIGVMGYMMKSRATLSANLTAEASGAASEALRNIRIVMSYGGYDVEVERYKAKLEHARDTDASSGRVQGATVGFMLFSMFATYAIGLFYGAVLIQENRDAHPQCTFDPTGPDCFSGGDVITIFFAMVIGGGAIARLAPGLTALATARAIAFTLYETIDAVPAKTALPDVGAAEPGKVLPAPTGNMSLRGVSFAYPSRPEQTVLHDINIDIPAGKTVALVGPSGSGKSTIAQLVQRLYDPTTGTVTFDGVDVKELQVQWLRDQQGVVSQQPVLFAASVKENILAGAPLSVRDDYGDDQIAGAAKIALAHGFIKALPDGYDTDVGASGGLLSGGQKQRVSIARAILHSRPMQIWDEATSALDSTNEAAVQAALDNLAATPGHSTPSRLIIAHRLSTIRGADLICVLDEGRIVERGTHEELLADANSLYSKLWGMQKLMEDGGGAAAAPEPTAPALAAPSLSRAVSAASDAGHVVVQVGGEEEVDTKNMTPEQKAAAALAALTALDETAEGADKALTEWKKTLPNVPFARVWEYQSPEKWYLFGGFFFAAIAGCIMPTFAIVLSTILNVFYETDADTLREESLFNMALFFGIAIAGFIANSGTIGLLSYTGGFMTTRLRMDAYRSVLKQGAEFFDRPENSAGRVVGRLAKDAQAVKAITGINLSMMIQQIASMALALVVAFLASWRVALVVLAIIPLLGASAAVNFKVRSGFESSSMKESKELSHLATEAIVNLRTVQSLGLERAMLLRFHSSQDATDSKAVRSAYIAGVTSGFAMFVLFATYALLFYVGSIWINDGVLTFPDLLQAMFVLIFAAQGLGQTSAFTVDSATADAAKRSLFQLIDMKPTIDPTDTTLAVPPALANATTGHSLRLKGVNFTYPVRPENPVLKGADLDIPAGKTVAIVGESGSGKSTVVQLLQRFYDPQGGAVEIDGVDIKTLPVSWLRSRFGWVPQEPRLFADSVAYNVGYGLLPDKLAPHAGVTLEAQEAAGKPGADPAVIPPSFRLPPAIPTAAEIANAAGFIGGLSYKYATHVGSEGSQLSGGQRQRVALARCLVREPAVMLLDEATSALDSQSEQVVQESIDAVLAAAAGTRTTVVIAHRLSTIKKADVVVVLQQGRVVETGTHDELVAAKGVYTAMVAAQSGVTVEAAAGGAAGGDQN